MKLDLKAMTITASVFWAIAVFFVGIANVISPEYGKAFLQVLASIYHGYDASGSMGDLIVGTLYALVDGAIAGFVFAWLYNLIAGRSR